MSTSKKKAGSTSLNSFDGEDSIPNERIRPNVIPLVPAANYIANSKHFEKYKSKWLHNVPSKSLQPGLLNL